MSKKLTKHGELIEAPRNPVGRPALPFNKEIAEKICELIATTPKRLQQLCDEFDEFPNRESQVYHWMIKSPEFSQMYLEAKQKQAMVYADQIMELADNPPGGRTPEALMHANIMIKARQWQAARLMPKIFGDKKYPELMNKEVEGSVAKSYEKALKELE